MRIAILADIHGNVVALEAVLTDIKLRGGVDEYWVLGDLVAIGDAPVRVLELLQQLPNAHFVRGNTDRYTFSGDRPPPTFDEVVTHPHLMGQLVEVAGCFAWTQGAITAAGHLDWLAQLPLECRHTLPDNTKVLCVHAAPGLDDGEGIHPTTPHKEIETLLAGCEETLICVGHTHYPFDVMVQGKRVIDPGSVSNHIRHDTRACYALLEANEMGYKIDFIRVTYDIQSVIKRLEQIKHPARAFILSYLRGER